MKITSKFLLASALLGISLAPAQAQTAITIGDEALLAGWDFNNQLSTSWASVGARYSDVFGDATSVATTKPAGTVYFNGTGGSDSWPTVSRVTTGADIDRPIDGRGALAGLGSLSGGEGMMSFTGYTATTKDEISFLIHSDDSVNLFENLRLSYWAVDSGNTGAGITIDWFYSIDGGSTKVSAGIQNTITGTTFTNHVANFSALSVLDGVSDVYLVALITESETAANFRLDNVAIYGTSAVPEPSTYGAILGALAMAGAVVRRRRRSPASAAAV